MNFNPFTLSEIGRFTIIFSASILIWILIVGIFILHFFIKKINKVTLINAILSAVNAWGISSIIKLAVPSVRPYLISGETLFTTTYHVDSSFPSGHAALVFAVATAIFLKNKFVGLVYFLGAIIVSYGRIASNAHFPIDVVGGAMIGVLIALVVDSIGIKLQKHKFRI